MKSSKKEQKRFGRKKEHPGRTVPTTRQSGDSPVVRAALGNWQTPSAIIHRTVRAERRTVQCASRTTAT
jgi:hypothetical protein